MQQGKMFCFIGIVMILVQGQYIFAVSSFDILCYDNIYFNTEIYLPLR